MREIKKVVGVIAEYNPFHHGHHYQLQKLRQDTQADVVVVLMSGNVVQRGEFAMLDKWTRAQLVATHGADLVIEMPLFATLQSADYFAKYCVQYVSQIGCDTLVFGTESATTAQLYAYLDWQKENNLFLQERIKYWLKQGYGYPTAFAKALENASATNWQIMTQPNHVLGLQYMAANQQLPSPMAIHTIQRVPSSASEVRNRWIRRQLNVSDVPEATWQALHTQKTVRLADYWALLRYQLTVQSVEQLQAIVGVAEGIEVVLKRALGTASDLDSLIQQVVSKRWTKARVQRVLIAILLNIRQTTWQNAPQSLRVLAYTPAGKHYLRQYANSEPALRLFSNYRQHDEEAYSHNLQADKIYQLNPHSVIPEQNRAKFPIFCENNPIKLLGVIDS
ncbi:MAG: nucleotidyltransferase family protein [Aerococcaceae bacterium]|nr:nucleotidyltransferase family protein [Aerococcaceae bacterium]